MALFEEVADILRSAQPPASKRDIKIKTTCIYPPIPLRQFDWCAVDDNTYGGDPRDPIGYGATEQEAIDDLLAIMDEEHA